MAEDDDTTVAVLELTIISAEGLKDMTFFGKTKKSFAIAWIDPRIKKPTKTLTTKNPSWNQNLSFPLHLQTLQNPTSFLTIQILSSSLLQSRVIGSSILALSAIRSDPDTFTLQIWKPSGRAQGLLRVSARIVWKAGVYPFQGCVTGIPVGLFSDRDPLGGSGYDMAVPTAPPMPAESGDSARRNFLIGLFSGAVAAVLVGSAVV